MALVTLGFGRSIDHFNFEGVETSLDGLREELGVLVHDVHAVPDRLVLGSISIKTANFYNKQSYQESQTE